MPSILEMLQYEECQSARPRLFGATEQSSSCECANPHDRLFVLLGMTSNNPFMDNDTTLTPTEVLFAAVKDFWTRKSLTMESSEFLSDLRGTLHRKRLSMSRHVSMHDTHIEELMSPNSACSAG